MGGGTGSLTLALGALPETDFCGRGRIRVVRKGRYHPVYALSFNGDSIAELAWQGRRRITYVASASGSRFDLKIGPMQRKIRAVDDDGRIAKIMVSSNHNLARREMRLLMGDGDVFLARRGPLDRFGATRLEIRKQHYLNAVLVFHFDPNDVAAPILIDVERLMRWEIRHFHPILALVTSRIGLEYKWNGVH